MGRVVYHGYYPKKCVDKDIIPYLKVDCDWLYSNDYNGKYLDRKFYEMIASYGDYYNSGDCYVINSKDVMEFVRETPLPQTMEDRILEDYDPDKDLIFWMR